MAQHNTLRNNLATRKPCAKEKLEKERGGEIYFARGVYIASGDAILIPKSLNDILVYKNWFKDNIIIYGRFLLINRRESIYNHQNL